MSKLRIGVMLRDDHNPQVGGGFNYYDAIVQAIDQYKFDDSLEFVILRFSSSNIKFTKQSIHIDIFPRLRLKEKLIGYAAGKTANIKITKNSRLNNSLAKAAKEINYSHVCKQLAENKIDLLYYLVPDTRTLNYPFVETHWDIGHLSMPAFPEVVMNNSFEAREKYYAEKVQKAFAVFCDSEAGKEELLHYKPINPAKLHVVPIFPGNIVKLVPSKEETISVLEQYNISHHQFFFYPAQFWSHKNHYGLITAFARLTHIKPDLKLVLSGSDKGNLAYIREVIGEYKLEEKVVLAGFISNIALNVLYRSAIALVMPSFLGPTNMPLLEAAAIGCRVICSDFKGHRELMHKESFEFVDPYDNDSIFEAMKKCVEEQKSVGPDLHPAFNIDNAVKQIETAFLKIRNVRKSFGFNFQQY